MNKDFPNETPFLLGMALCPIESIYFLFILDNKHNLDYGMERVSRIAVDFLKN